MPPPARTTASTTKGHGDHSSPQLVSVAVTVHTVPGPSRFSHATYSTGTAAPDSSPSIPQPKSTRHSSQPHSARVTSSTNGPMVRIESTPRHSPAPARHQSRVRRPRVPAPVHAVILTRR